MLATTSSEAARAMLFLTQFLNCLTASFSTTFKGLMVSLTLLKLMLHNPVNSANNCIFLASNLCFSPRQVNLSLKLDILYIIIINLFSMKFKINQKWIQ